MSEEADIYIVMVMIDRDAINCFKYVSQFLFVVQLIMFSIHLTTTSSFFSAILESEDPHYSIAMNENDPEFALAL